MSPKAQSTLLGAAVVAVLSTSYLGLINCLCCAGVIAGAMVAVWHYTETNKLTLPTGEGVMMGVAAAAIGWVIASILNFIIMTMGIRSDQVISEYILEMFRDQMPPEQIDQMEEQMNQPVTLATYFGTINLWIGLVVSIIFGAIGGAVGASVFKKGETPGAPETGTV